MGVQRNVCRHRHRADIQPVNDHATAKHLCCRDPIGLDTILRASQTCGVIYQAFCETQTVIVLAYY